jgi:outer membrane protein, adhesin transport system
LTLPHSGNDTESKPEKITGIDYYRKVLLAMGKKLMGAKTSIGAAMLFAFGQAWFAVPMALAQQTQDVAPKAAGRLVIASASEQSLVPAATGLEPNLERILRQTIQQHPTVNAEQLNKLAAQEDLDSAKLQRLPNFSYQTETSGHKPTSTLAMQVPLWNFGRTDATIGAASSTLDAQDAKLREAQQGLALKVFEHWNAAQAAHKRLQIQAATRVKLESFSNMMKRRIDAQVSPPIEAELVESRLRQIENDESLTRTQLKIALSRLSLLAGQTVGPDDIATDASHLHHTRLLTNTGLTSSLIAASVSDKHPSLERARASAQAAMKEAQARDAARYPEVFFKWYRSGGRNTETSHGGFIGLRAETSAGFSAANAARSASARAQAQEQALETTRRELEEQMQTERESLRNASQRSARLSQAVMSAAQVVDSYERLFVAGRRSWQEVLNALREYNDFQLAHTDSQFETMLNIWRLRVRGAESIEGDFLASR